MVCLLYLLEPKRKTVERQLVRKCRGPTRGAWEREKWKASENWSCVGRVVLLGFKSDFLVRPW